MVRADIVMSNVPEPNRVFGPPTEIGSLWFEEIRRRSETPSIAWSEATEIAGTLLTHLGECLEGSAAVDQLPVALVEGALPEIEDVIALRSVFRVRALDRLEPPQAMALLQVVDELVDRLVACIVQSKLHALESAAFLDPLTGVGNRRALDRDLARELARAFRHGRPVALAEVDLDGLKAINDTSGHAAGDAALRRLATALTETLRVGDVVYRVGGDEFVVVLPETEASSVAPLLVRARALAPSFSFGVAEAPTDATTPEALLALADANLIAGRRRVREEIPAPPSRGADLASSSATGETRSPMQVPLAATVLEPCGVRLVIEEIVSAAAGRGFTAAVTLRDGTRKVVGRASGSSASAAAKRIVAEATVDALAAIDERWGDLFIEAVSIVQVGEIEVAVVNVVVADGATEETVTGVAEVRRRRRDDAVARAVLDALNRRLSARPAASVQTSVATS